MARKARPPAWNLTIKQSTRTLFFRYLEVFRPKDRNESKNHASLMDLWEGEDDLSKSTPSLEPGIVQAFADLLVKFGVNEKMVEGLATDLKRMPATDESITMLLSREDVEFLLTVYDRVVGDNDLTKQAPHLTRGAVTRQLIPYVEAFEQAIKSDGEETEGVLVAFKPEAAKALTPAAEEAKPAEPALPPAAEEAA